MGSCFIEGFILSPAGRSAFLCRAFLLSFSSDLPANAIVLNFVQFNGYWGCGRCKQEGKSIVVYWQKELECM